MTKGMTRSIICFALALFASPLFAEDHLQQGARYLDAGNPRRAARAYQLALKQNQDNAAAHKGLGLAYFRLGDLQVGYDTEMITTAVKELRASLEAAKDPEVYYHLGLCYLVLYEKKKAEEVLGELKVLDPALAGRLAGKIAGYVKPPRMELAHAKVSRGNGGGAASGATPVAIVGNTVLVPVSLSYRGNTVQARLILDTGASVTTISEELAAQLGVQKGDTNAMSGMVADGRRVDARWFVADAVGVGPKSAEQLRTVILAGSGGAGHDGLLGMDFLRKYRYHVDFDRQVIDWMN